MGCGVGDPPNAKTILKKKIIIIIKVYNRISDPLNLPVSKYTYFYCIFFVLWFAGKVVK